MFLSYLKKEKQKHGDEFIFNSAKLNNEINELNFDNTQDQNKYEQFWNKVKISYPISSNKEFRFLKWRYDDHPTKKYNVFYSQKNDQITGIIVMRAEHVWGFNVGIIMDLILLDLTDKTLLKFASKSFKKMKLDFIAALHTNIGEYKTLKKNNFFKIPQKILPQKIHFIVRKNKDFEDEEMIFKPDNWKLTFGDYDIF